MLKKLVWFLGFLGLLALVALIYLTTIPKDDAPNSIQKILPSSFFATEYNSFSKNFHSSYLYSITAIDKKTLVAVGDDGVILKSTDGGESFKKIESGIYNYLNKAIYFNDRVYIVGYNLGVIYLDTKEWKLHFLDYFTKNNSWFYPLLGAFLFYLLSWLFLLYKISGKSEQMSSNLSNNKALDAISQYRYGTSILASSLATLISSLYTKAPLSIAIDAP